MIQIEWNKQRFETKNTQYWSENPFTFCKNCLGYFHNNWAILTAKPCVHTGLDYLCLSSSSLISIFWQEICEKVCNVMRHNHHRQLWKVLQKLFLEWVFRKSSLRPTEAMPGVEPSSSSSDDAKSRKPSGKCQISTFLSYFRGWVPNFAILQATL